MLKNELNVLSILQSLQKMKAAFSILIPDKEEELLKKTKQLYYQNASIFLNQEKEDQFNKSKNNFIKFMETDLRDLLRNEINSPDEFFEDHEDNQWDIQTVQRPRMKIKKIDKQKLLDPQSQVDLFEEEDTGDPYAIQ